MASNSFKVKNSLVLTPKDLSTLTSPEAGDLACDINDNNKIKRYDANAAAWVEVGSGGVGGVDIFFVQDFESASLSSFTQTGLVLSQTDPLKGKVSAVLNHQAAINQSFKQIIPVDRKFRGQSMVLRLDSKSDASQGNLVINIYDETNSANLVSSEQLQLSNDVNGRKTSVSFTIPETCASLSYTITALPESGKVSRIDDIICELSESALLETSVVTPNVTAWQGYTPTFQGFGTPTNVEFEWRQVGEDVEVRGKFTSGTPTAVEARVGLPAGLTSAGTGLIPSIQVIGKGNRSSTSSTTNFGGLTVLIEPSVTYFTFGNETSTANGSSKVNADTILAASQNLTFFAKVPCAGLSAVSTKTIPLTQSGLIKGDDSTVRVIGASGYGSTNTSVVRFTTLTQSVGSNITYSSSATAGDSFTVVSSGVYSISAHASISVSSDDFSVAISKNSTVFTASPDSSILSYGRNRKSSVIANNTTAGCSWTGYLVSGDIIRFVTDGQTLNSAQPAGFTITQQGSLKQLNVSSDQKITIPTSELRMEGASTRGSTATAIVRFDTTAKLRGDAFTVESDSVLGTRITMKKAGKLDISTNLIFAAASSDFTISLNQQILTSTPVQSECLARETVAAGVGASASTSVFVKIGDVIRVSANQVPSGSILNNLNLSFQEQEIAVSVTNTLPQFSESDSSVRVNTANGYGSTASNKIRRFSSVVDNIGTDIAYVDSATDGASFTVLSSGVYNVTYTDQFSAQCLMGLSRNASSLTSAIQSLTASQILAVTNSVSLNQPESVSWQGYLSAGDIIRPHSEGTSAGTTTSAVNFTISKVGKPNVTGVNVTPFVNVPQSDVESIAYLGTGAQLLDVTTEVRFPTSISTTNKGIIAIQDDSGNTRTKFTALKRCTVNVSWSASINGAGNYANVYKNGSVLQRSTALYISTGIAQVSWTGILDVGDFLSFGSSSSVVSDATLAPVYITATALSNQILTAPETFSTDTASLRYANASEYTLSTLANAPVGTYITFTYAANTNTRTQTTLTNRPTQTDADMNVNGILLYTRAYNAASTAAQPAAIAIQIGKGLKGVSQYLYKSAGKVTAGSLDKYNNVASFASSQMQSYGALTNYNEITGVLLIDAGYQQANVVSTSFDFSDLSTQTSGYLVINASKSPALTGVPLVQPRIATLKDVKASSTQGGTFTSGAWQTRTLNTLSDSTGIITSLASNQFVLSAGTYFVEAFAPAHGVAAHQSKIRNITDSNDAIVGGCVNAPADTSTISIISGEITITSSKTFELQHQAQVTQATNGFGNANAFGANQIYSQVKITKVK